jgi:hypothetical protein
VGNVSGLRLQQKQQVPVSLRLFVVGEDTFLHLGRFFKVTRHFVLLAALSA